MKNKKHRVDYFMSLINLANTLIAEISFKKEKLTDVLTEYAAYDKTELRTHITEFCASPFSKPDIKSKMLKKDERRLVSDFFSSLGATDGETQIFGLENYKSRFNEIYSSESEKFKRLGTVGLKLSVLLGIAVGILII